VLFRPGFSAGASPLSSVFFVERVRFLGVASSAGVSAAAARARGLGFGASDAGAPVFAVFTGASSTDNRLPSNSTRCHPGPEIDHGQLHATSARRRRAPISAPSSSRGLLRGFHACAGRLTGTELDAPHPYHRPTLLAPGGWQEELRFTGVLPARDAITGPWGRQREPHVNRMGGRRAARSCSIGASQRSSVPCRCAIALRRIRSSHHHRNSAPHAGFPRR